MTPEQIASRAASGESVTLEFKKFTVEKDQAWPEEIQIECLDHSNSALICAPTRIGASLLRNCMK
ncbi:MAG: hypothetical protein HKUEN07_04890 [Rhodocyclaceae bacterium]|jgi:CxxC motif-containing protein|uniref:Uncharacterized protein n=1 Tax=Candidatus Desulfobacillus denitrificans TaxID=2608985 RepID=A0A809RYH2_9PROT|nr:hypothetical protein [Steroidobacteraceae bacterium]MCL4723548.1 hypothetical protein [Rhodocyclaceae bacterium]MCZ2112694.1 hypothetical protein [Anaerolineae bacterium]BBO21246.1 hypothetical protein DSYM_19450 [Candidatus Desulfobacillus denitrificans]GIK46487.1 MAG: hypothetical protein BroJett012_23900 [Betaproteobacteria bacterium]